MFELTPGVSLKTCLHEKGHSKLARKLGDYLERAKAWERMIDSLPGRESYHNGDKGYVELSKRLGISEDVIRETLALLEQPKEIQVIIYWWQYGKVWKAMRKQANPVQNLNRVEE